MYEVWDAVYGTYNLPKICGDIINSLEFQRLRDVSVMGPVSWVFPSATHSMYEHSIGAAVLAHRWSSRLSAKFEVSQTDVLNITVAALLRNIGCMPWESVFRDFMREQGDTTKMEHASVKIVSDMLRRQQFSLDTGLIKDLIIGYPENAPPDWKWSAPREGRLFMFDLVNAAGYDAISVDRLIRCNVRLGLRASININAFIENSRVDESTHLVTPDSMSNLEDHINKTVLGHVDVAAVSVAIQTMWKRSVWIKKATKDVGLLMRASDLTFKSDIEYTFFHNDLMSRRFPKLASETHFMKRSDMDAFIHNNPAKPSTAYHKCTLKNNSIFILRLFYLPQ